MNLFDQARPQPLAERMRPRRLAEVIGQAHLIAGEGQLGRLVRADRVPSMILWGPPGTGKTTLANVIAAESQARFVPFSAVLGGVPQLRKLIAEANEQSRMGKRTLLFVDEIHRFNKSQQDALLPHVENGTVVLIGATTENPAFAVNRALLSRARVFRLEPLSDGDIRALVQRAFDAPGGLDGNTNADEDALDELARLSRGDARRALTLLESLASDGRTIDLAMVRCAFEATPLPMDEDERYSVLSAFIKSMRGSDPDASVYWMMRLIEGGEDPKVVGRRLIIFASEDVGNADPRALSLAVAADAAVQRVGLPECLHALAQCTIYMAVAPKSDASYRAFGAAKADIAEHGALPVPMHLRTGPTPGYGEGYRNPHREGGVARGERYLPEGLSGRVYYEPKSFGFEGRIRQSLEARRREQEET